MHQLTLQIFPWLFLQGKPMVELGAHSSVPKEWKFPDISVPSNHRAAVLLPSSCSSSTWVGNSVCEPQVGRRQQDMAQDGAVCVAEAAVPPCWIRTAQDSLAQGHGGL